MDREKMVDGWGKELARVRSQMDELGPIAVGTLSRSTKKYRTKDGAEHTSRKYVIGATADEIWSRLRATALAAGYGCGLRRTGVGAQAMGNSEGRLASVVGRGCCGMPQDEQKEMGKFRPYCLLPAP